jgi:predicted RNase H-like HicB family nuclease
MKKTSAASRSPAARTTGNAQSRTRRVAPASRRKRAPASGVIHVVKDGILYELRPEPEGGYTINVPALRGCISYGETIDEALFYIEDAMRGWLEVARAERFPVPAQFDIAVPMAS